MNAENTEKMTETSNDWMDALKNGDYVDFSKAIKQEINSRYANHPFVKDIEAKHNYYTKLSSYFANVPLNDFQARETSEVSDVSEE
jgi:hypothetical protein